MIEGRDVERPTLSFSKTLDQVIVGLSVLVGFLLAIPVDCYPALQQVGSAFNRLDGSWQLELPARLARGELAGRDFIFTYGPLYQLTHALGFLVPPGDPASLIRFQSLPEAVLSMLCVWFLLQWTGAPLRLRALAFLLWGCLWPPMTGLVIGGLKPLAGPLGVGLCARALAPSGDREADRKTAQAMVPWIFTAPVLVLYAFDLGILALIALVLTAALVWFCAGKGQDGYRQAKRRLGVRCGSAAVCGFIAFGLTLSLIPGWHGYWRDSWELASGYPAVLSSSINWIDLAAIAAAFCCALSVLIFALRRLGGSCHGDLGRTQRALSLIAVSCFCLVWLRTALTRSHVTNALIPTLLLIGCLLPLYLRAEGMSFARPLLAALLLFLPLSTAMIDTLIIEGEKPSLTQRLTAMRNLELRGARLEITENAMRRAVDTARGLPGKALYVWPYESVVGVVANRLNPDYTLQSYAATTDSLESATVQRLESIPDLPVFVFTDSWAIDGVENLTRTPHIFRYLLEYYESTGSTEDSFVRLERRPRAPRQWREQELSVLPMRFAPGDDRPLAVELAEKNLDCRASDLLVLRLRSAKTSLLGIGKPGQLSAIFRLSNGEQRTQNLLLPEDGESHDILVSAATLRDQAFLSIFAPNYSWRSTERMVAIELRWTALDPLSIRPSSITLERVSILHRENAVTSETPLAK